MEEKDKVTTYRIFNEKAQWAPFEVDVFNGKVAACRGATKHPIGSDWSNLIKYYIKLQGDQAAKVEKVVFEQEGE